MNCDNCVKAPDPVPYLVHEADMARQERTIKNLWIVIILMFVLFVVTVCALGGGFVWYLNQYDFESYSYEQDGQGINIIGDRNGVNFDVTESGDSPQN